MFNPIEPTPSSYANNDWLQSPSTSWVGRLIGGIAVPFALIGFGIWCLANNTGYLPFPYDNQLYRVETAGVGMVALMYLGTAVFAHSHWFHFDRAPLISQAIHQFGRVVGLVMLVIGLGAVLLGEFGAFGM